jgi:hypothetical protein
MSVALDQEAVRTMIREALADAIPEIVAQVVEALQASKPKPGD